MVIPVTYLVRFVWRGALVQARLDNVHTVVRGGNQQGCNRHAICVCVGVCVSV